MEMTVERDVCAFHGVGVDSAEDRISKMQMGMYPILKHGTLVMYRFRSKYICCSLCALDWNSFIYQKQRKDREGERKNKRRENDIILFLPSISCCFLLHGDLSKLSLYLVAFLSGEYICE